MKHKTKHPEQRTKKQSPEQTEKRTKRASETADVGKQPKNMNIPRILTHHLDNNPKNNNQSTPIYLFL